LPKRALPRIYRIEKEIASGKYPNSDGLAWLCEVSISTIGRDIDFKRDQLLAPIDYSPFYDASRQLLESITMPITTEGNNDWLEKRISVPPIASAKVKPDIWDVIVAGLKGNRVITFDYKGAWDDDYFERIVHP
jgi:hypothetical protein